MKLKGLIASVLLLSTLFVNAQPGKDSIAHIRKPVLQHLLEQDKRAIFYFQETNRLTAKVLELGIQVGEYLKIIESYKADSVETTAIIATADASAKGWENTYNDEKKSHDNTKKKWRRRAFVVVVGNVALVVVLILLL